MKLISENHIRINLVTQHPAYGFLEIDEFQRDSRNFNESKIIWKGVEIPIEKIWKTPAFWSVYVPWDYQTVRMS